MKVMHGDPATWDAAGPHVVTIGVFDGVHRGHCHVIELAKVAAARLGISSGLITFDRHPLTVLAPEHAPLLLTSFGQRLELFEQSGLDTIGVLPFGDAVRTLSPEDFVMRVIVEGFGARLVVVGEDFRFGQDRAGNVEVLALMGAEMGFGVEPVTLLNDEGPLSSSRIRALIAEGEVGAATEALGRRFELLGRVVSERGQDGRTGLPVANLVVSQGLAVPGNGVYAVRASFHDCRDLPGLVYIGMRPTFGGSRQVIQFSLLDGMMDLGGVSVHLQFAGRVRSEQLFPDPRELAAAIESDLDAARRLLD